MKFLIHLIAESEVGQHVQEIACLERKEHRLEDVGLTLREAKKLLGAIQQRMVEQQVEEYLETQRNCPHCGSARGLKGSHTVTFQTLFGNLELCSPRWNHLRVPAKPSQDLQSATRTAGRARVTRTIVSGDQVGFVDLL